MRFRGWCCSCCGNQRRAVPVRSCGRLVRSWSLSRMIGSRAWLVSSPGRWPDSASRNAAFRSKDGPSACATDSSSGRFGSVRFTRPVHSATGSRSDVRGHHRPVTRRIVREARRADGRAEGGANDDCSIVFDVYEPGCFRAPDACVNLGGRHAQRLGQLPVCGRFSPRETGLSNTIRSCGLSVT
jgi:hypothetical protein